MNGEGLHFQHDRSCKSAGTSVLSLLVSYRKGESLFLQVHVNCAAIVRLRTNGGTGVRPQTTVLEYILACNGDSTGRYS